MSPPFVLEADATRLASSRSTAASIVINSWEEAFSRPDFGVSGDSRIHLGLIPQPFFGDLRRASIFLLLLNPGLGPDDYFGEFKIPGFRDALLANLKQDASDASQSFLFLDPQYSWHGGFEWWHSKFAQIIHRLSQAWGVSFAAARSRLASSIASIELFPYHSASFHDADHWIENLPSVQLAREFVNQEVLPRVGRGEAIVIVTRKAFEWAVSPQDGVIAYSSTQARAAHLTPSSPGGQAILTHLLKPSGG